MPNECLILKPSKYLLIWSGLACIMMKGLQRKGHILLIFSRNDQLYTKKHAHYLKTKISSIAAFAPSKSLQKNVIDKLPLNYLLVMIVLALIFLQITLRQI